MSVEEEIAKLEEARAQRKAARAEEGAKQHLLDLQAREALEDEHADTGLATVSVSRFVPGQPTFAVVRTPSKDEYKRYLDQLGRAQEKKSSKAQRDAMELLAQSCWIYPLEREARQAMLGVFPGILMPIVVAVSELAEGRVEDEKNG